jgi:hypothetical protein
VNPRELRAEELAAERLPNEKVVHRDRATGVEYTGWRSRARDRDAFATGYLEALTYTEEDIERVARGIATRNGYRHTKHWKIYWRDAVAALEAFGATRVK